METEEDKEMNEDISKLLARIGPAKVDEIRAVIEKARTARKRPKEIVNIIKADFGLDVDVGHLDDFIPSPPPPHHR